MGAISEKLVYLNGTKQAIKQAINEDFEVIDDNTTFREYAEEISSNNAKYKDLIPKETKNAANTLDISNSSGLDKALVTQYGNTYQETTTGKNLLRNTGTSTTKNGLTYTVNSDGTFTINGTATSTSYYEITNSFTFNDGVTYMMSGCPSDGTSSSYYMIHNASPWNTDYGQGAPVNGTGKSVSIQVVVVSGTTCNNLLFKPQIELGSTKTSYEPYTNGASPNPDYPQTITNVTGINTIKINGKNLLENTLTTQTISGITFTKNSDGTITANGTASASIYLTLNSSVSLGAGTYILSGCPSGGSSSKYTLYENSKGWNSFDYGSGVTITLSESKTFRVNLAIYSGTSVSNLVFKPMIEKGTTASTYEAYKEQNYTINLEDIELCKIGDYQDRIYPLNGKWYLEKKIGKVVLNGTQTINQINTTQTNTTRVMYQNFVQGKSSSIDLYCSHLAGVINWNVDTEGMYINNTDLVFRMNKTTIGTTLESVQTWLSTHNTIVYYVLATPTTEEITESNYPTLYNQLNNIKLFEGVNHITMTNESGLDVEFNIEYYKDWKLD